MHYVDKSPHKDGSTNMCVCLCVCLCACVASQQLSPLAPKVEKSHLSSPLHHHSACIINGSDYCNQKFLFIWRSGRGASPSRQQKKKPLPLVSILNFSEIAMPQCTLKFGDKLGRHTDILILTRRGLNFFLYRSLSLINISRHKCRAALTHSFIFHIFSLN